MRSFIEDLYYGNIDPQARSFTQNKAVQKNMQILSDCEEYLRSVLDGESLKGFESLINAVSEVSNASNLDSFITGFRLGANFALDAFCETSAPYTDILRDPNDNNL